MEKNFNIYVKLRIGSKIVVVFKLVLWNICYYDIKVLFFILRLFFLFFLLRNKWFIFKNIKNFILILVEKGKNMYYLYLLNVVFFVCMNFSVRIRELYWVEVYLILECLFVFILVDMVIECIMVCRIINKIIVFSWK